VAPPLRIANVMLGRRLGGLEQALLDYTDALSRTGHEVHAVVHPDAAIRPALEQRGAAWHGLAHLGEWDPLAALRLRLLLRQMRAQLCIAHGNRAMRLLRRSGASPIIAVLPNYKMTCRGAAAVCHPTMDLRRYARDQGVAEDRLYHIPSMVRVPLAPPRRVSHRPPVIGAMGRFVAKKGFAVFIEALARLRASGAPFRAVLAGDGPQCGALQRLAAERGLSDVLSFPGWVHDKPAFFAAIDIFCLPSHHEPFGIVLIEAMAQALPVVATDSEGPAEILRDGTHGIVVPRADAPRMAEALHQLIAEPDRASWFGANAYRRAREEFDLPRVAARLDEVVRRVAHRASLQSVEVTA
jgi:glycosyltransferase involved in cell wall biosynthesis